MIHDGSAKALIKHSNHNCRDSFQEEMQKPKCTFFYDILLLKAHNKKQEASASYSVTLRSWLKIYIYYFP